MTKLLVNRFDNLTEADQALVPPLGQLDSIPAWHQREQVRPVVLLPTRMQFSAGKTLVGHVVLSLVAAHAWQAGIGTVAQGEEALGQLLLLCRSRSEAKRPHCPKIASVTTSLRLREASGPGRVSAGKLALQKSSTMTYNSVRKVSASSTVSSFRQGMVVSLSYRVTFLLSNSHQAFHSWRLRNNAFLREGAGGADQRARCAG